MKFITTNDLLTIVLSRREQLASMKAKLSVKKSEITNLHFAETFRDWKRWEVRLPGTYVPRLLVAGSFWTEDGWDFMFAKHPRGALTPLLINVMVIELSGHQRYKRLIISASTEEFKRLERWYKSKK